MTSTGPAPPIGDASVTTGPAMLAVGGFAIALFGVYWDDAWHTDRGRDDLFSAPHVALYAGVTIAVAVVAWWAWCRRGVGWRHAFSGAIGVAVMGAVVTLGSAPVDEWWHTSFGRDAVLWSPPHLVALVGTIGLGTGVVLSVAGSEAIVRRRVGRLLVIAAGAGAVGAWQVLVLEYDTDVAQFSAFWYLPVLAAGLSAAVLTVQIALGPRWRWPAAWVGVAYTLAMVAVIALLSSTGFSTPIVPMVVPAMIAADVTRRRDWPVMERSLLFVAVVFGVYMPYLLAVPGGVAPSTAEAIAGVPLAVVAVAMTIVVFDPSAHWRSRLVPAVAAATVALAVLAVLFGGASRTASAHDPGQGVETADIVLTVDVTGELLEITATPDGSLADVRPVRVLARRAGELRQGPLAADGGSWIGQVRVDGDGRWFVYVEARRGEELLEAWLPVIVGEEDRSTRRTVLYIPATTDGAELAQLLAGITLLALAATIVGRVAATVRAMPSA